MGSLMHPHRRIFLALLIMLFAPQPGLADDVSATFFTRTDSDGTRVISPGAEVRVDFGNGETQLEAGYSMDIWTSASIDVRTAATRPVTEQRDELRGALRHEADNTTILGAYRYSTETDYISHGGSITVLQSLANGSADVGGSIFAAADEVGRSGDNAFSRDLATLGVSMTYNQILDRRTLMQMTYEFARREGYQASPYRFVAIGGDGLCSGDAITCVPESHPDVRLRHATVLRLRRAMGDDHSLGASFRFYIDNWGILSTTASTQWAWVVGRDSTLRTKYRYYRQQGADFYRSSYEASSAGLPALRSRDRELSPMDHHRVALSLEHAFEITDSGPTTRITIGLGGAMLNYMNFVGLDRIYAADLVLSASVDL